MSLCLCIFFCYYCKTFKNTILKDRYISYVHNKLYYHLQNGHQYKSIADLNVVVVVVKLQKKRKENALNREKNLIESFVQNVWVAKKMWRRN